MANAQKYTRAACGHLAAHYERRKDEKGEYIKFGNQDIDPQKTHLNYNLAPRRGLEQIDFIRQRTAAATAEAEAKIKGFGTLKKAVFGVCWRRRRDGKRKFLVPSA